MTTKFLIGDGAGNTTDLSSLYISKNKFLYGADSNSTFGQLFAFGNNAFGGFGNGATTSSTYTSVSQSGTAANWTTVCGTYATAALKTDGTLWTCGYNSASVPLLGDGTTLPKSSFVQIGIGRKWSTVSMGINSGYAISNGFLWVWGSNTKGQLGTGNNTTTLSPVQVGGLNDWSVVVTLPRDSGSNTSFPAVSSVAAIKTDGTLWAWGDNLAGQLGTSSKLSVSSPVQVGSLNTWSLVTGANESTLAVKTDGTLWGWGRNLSGELWASTATSSPVQLGTDTNWLSVSCQFDVATTVASGAHCVAIKTDGTLWAWGDNSSGQLGTGGTTPAVSPVQIGAMTNWKYATAGSQFSLAIKTDGTLWVWGSGGGAIGAPPSPVQVGVITTWKKISSATEIIANAIR
jgi:alpha-tubulin suppressor-like RCC1 family protein